MGYAEAGSTRESDGKSIPIGADGSGSASLSFQAQGRIIGYWTPSYSPDAQPPATVTIRFKPLIEAWGGYGATCYYSTTRGYFPRNVTLSDPQLDDGFGDPFVLKSDSPGDPNSLMGLGTKTWQSSALRLKTFSTTGGSWDYTSGKRWKVVFPLIKMSGALNATASGYTERPGPGPGVDVSGVNVMAYAPSGVTGDTRSVRIGRSGAPAPKSANDPTLDKTKDEWVEADGTGHGHTLYSYVREDEWQDDLHLPHYAQIDEWRAQGFAASRSGSWGSSFNWWWNPTGGVTGNPFDNDSIDGSLQQMPKGSLRKDVNGNWVGSASSPAPRTQTYTLEDKGADGAKASVSYILTLHDEFEKNYADNMVQRNINLRQAPGAQWVTSTRDESDLQVYAEQAYGWDVGVQVTGTPSAFMAGQLGITVGGSKNTSTNVGAGTTLTNVAAGWGTYLEQYDAVKIHTGNVDSWTPSGYAGTAPYTITEPDTPAGDVQAHALVYRGVGGR